MKRAWLWPFGFSWLLLGLWIVLTHTPTYSQAPGVSVIGAVTAGNCVKFASAVQLQDAGSVCGGSSASALLGNSASIAQNSTVFCNLSYCSSGAGTELLQPLAAGHVRNLYVHFANSVASGQSVTIWWWQGGVTALTCQVFGFQTSCNDTTHSVVLSPAGNAVFLAVQTSATSGATGALAWAVELDVP